MRRNLDTVLGVLFEFFVADFLTVLGLTGQKLALEKATDDHRVAISSTISNKLWVISFICFLVGQGVEAFSLLLASQTDVASVSNLTLFWNALFAYKFFNESFNIFPVQNNNKERHISQYGTMNQSVFHVYSRSIYEYCESWDLFNYLLLIFGSFLVILTAPGSIDFNKITLEELLENWIRFPYLGYNIVVLCLIITISIFLYHNWNNNKYFQLNATLVATLSATLSSLTLTLSKMFMTILQKITLKRIHTFTPTPTIIIYIFLILVWISTTISSIYVLNLGLSRFEQTKIVPLYEIIGTINTISSGILFYEGYKKFSTISFLVFLLGIIMMCLGIFLVSSRKEHRNENEEKLLDQDDETESLLR